MEKSATLDLTVLLPVLNERDNLAALLPRLAGVLRRIDCKSEVVVVDGGSGDGTVELARSLGARVFVQRSPGYGGALREGFAEAKGQYIVTCDADLSHDPDFVAKLWRARRQADVVIASRYVSGGVAYMPFHREVLSRILNRFFALGLDLPLRDLSSGFRLYRAAVLEHLEPTGRNFDVLQEILVKAYAAGWRVIEIPFTYYPRDRGSSHARIFRFGLALLHAFARLWTLRNSAGSADSDERAFYSRIPLRRWRQRRHHRIVTGMARGGGRTLDLGCGSSVILQSLNNAVGVDIQQNKLRYMRRYEVPLVRASVASLPFRSGSFDCVVCTQAIDHLPGDAPAFAESMRVLRSEGLLILGIADHAEAGAKESLVSLAAAHGLEVVEEGFVLRSGLVLALRKLAGSKHPATIRELHPEAIREMASPKASTIRGHP